MDEQPLHQEEQALEGKAVQPDSERQPVAPPLSRFKSLTAISKGDRVVHEPMTRIKRHLNELEAFERQFSSTAGHSKEQVDQFIDQKAEQVGVEVEGVLAQLDARMHCVPPMPIDKVRKTLDYYTVLNLYITQAYLFVASIKKQQNHLISTRFTKPHSQDLMRLELIRDKNSAFRDTIPIEEPAQQENPMTTESEEEELERLEPVFHRIVRRYDDYSIEINLRTAELNLRLRELEGEDSLKRHAIWCCGREMACVS